MNWIYQQPVKILFGNGVIKELNHQIEAIKGSRGVLITSSSFAARGISNMIKEICGNKIVAIYSQVTANTDIMECDECIDLVRTFECDFVVAIGGGSVIDCAKAVSVISQTEGKTSDYWGTANKLPSKHIPLIAIPTTAGTGSEIISVAVLSDHKQQKKASFASPSFYPAIAMIDPELTYTLSPYITACSGFDTFCHALEAYWCRNHQPICDALAIESLRLVLANLLTAYNEHNNVAAREKMAEASLLAGMAFAIPKTTSAHACSYPLTALFDITHGEACAMTIDHFLRINAMDKDKRIESLVQMLGFDNSDLFAGEIVKLREKLYLRGNLKEFNITDHQLDELVEQSKHPNLLNNPIEVTDKILRDMYNKLR